MLMLALGLDTVMFGIANHLVVRISGASMIRWSSSLGYIQLNGDI